ncbi:MAG: trypsin-like peptidase domain-containing protein [Eubacteriales bacterium]|nr:trypsin-like peptidase domain-containing protein [Eubacteriales bacterium]
MGKGKINLNTGKQTAHGAKVFALILTAIFLVACITLAAVLAIFIDNGSLDYYYDWDNATARVWELATNNPLPDMIEAVTPSVVGVVTYAQSPYSSRDDLEILGSGSGFIVSSDGYVLTNEHVVDDAEQIRVLFSNGDEVVAELVGSDVTTDVAVLKIEADGLVPVTFGDSDTIRVGEFALAIGNPLDTSDLYGTVTFGIISAAAREINIDGFTNEYIQTDAAVNFGNSGGPLMSTKGEVIGMTTAKYVTAGYDEYGNSISAEGIGFALPINNVRLIMNQLIADGQIQRPGIGVSVYAINDIDAQQAGLVAGVYVDSVTEGGPADLSGIKSGDVIVKMNGIETMELDAMTTIIRAASIGDEMKITVNRKGEEIELTIVIGDMNKMP